MHIRLLIMTLLLLSVSAGRLAAQRPAPQRPARDTAKTGQVQIDFSNTFEIFQTPAGLIRKLVGEVELRQDSIFMYCDSAIISDRDTRVQAMGNVVIQQGDSISTFADSLIYNGTTRIARLYGEVVLQSGQQRLFTDSLRYDLQTKTATYTSGATLVNGETQLSSKRGYYYVGTDEAYFKDSVVVIDPQFSLRSDTLKFNTKTNVATFLGPTLISDDSTRIYTEAGYYDLQNKVAEFTQNAQYVRGAQQARATVIRYDGAREAYSLIGEASFEEGARRATADTIRYDERNDKTYLVGKARYLDDKQEIEAPQIIYDARNEVYSTRGRSRISDPPQLLEADTVDYSEERGLGIALGNVIWQDTSADLTIRCGRADYDRKTDYLKAMGGTYGRPLLITLMEGDSLFLAADTLLAVRLDTMSDDSSRLLMAFHDVRIFKSDLQALCDSLTYNSRDSIFRFFVEPIVWSDTSQFIADTIWMQMKNEKLDQIHLDSRALIVNSSDEIFFNQIKGKNITAYFVDDQLHHMDVIGNAESIYYALDEAGAYIGVNETVCSEMIIFWGDNTVDRIRFLNQPQGTAHPMGKVKHDELRLEGFRWVTEGRPRRIEDLFGERKPGPPAGPARATPPLSGDIQGERKN